jgi:hypothetical protein
MSSEECSFVLGAAYSRAMNGAAPSDRSGIRRAFRRAARAASEGDARPTILLSYRYP